MSLFSLLPFLSVFIQTAIDRSMLIRDFNQKDYKLTSAAKATPCDTDVCDLQFSLNKRSLVLIESVLV